MKFNKIIYSVVALIMVTSFWGCKDVGSNFLDRKPNDQIDAEQVFSRYNKVNQLVNDLYANIKSANRPLVFFTDFSSASATDAEEATTVEESQTNRFNTGDWGPQSMPDEGAGHYWSGLYAKIRKANVILEGVKKYGTPDNPLNPGDLEKRIGEVYFMRAYLHWVLARDYGEIKYMTHTVAPEDPMDFKRESFHTIVDKICADADSAFARVPGRWEGQDFGRIDKGAVLGLKAVARWMAATPLWNGGDLPNDTRNFQNEYTYDESRWEKAKTAAKAVLDFKVDGQPRYTLYQQHDKTEFENDAGNNTSNSKVYTRLWDMFYDIDAFKQEFVFFITKDKGSAWQGDIYPPSWGGSSRQQPTQEQVDEYEYISPDGYGYPVYSSKAETDGYNDENPYESVKRDPRFYRDIIYHGSTFKNTVINTATGPDKIGASNATKTGYYLHKLFKESWNRDKNFSINAPPIWRLPQFIYIYAEAVNETTGPNREIYDLINKVRERSFMAPMPPEVMSNKELMSEYIQRERRVEFFHENHRFWTLRLEMQPTSDKAESRENAWKASGSTNNERSQNYWPYPQTQHMINGMKPIQDPDGKIVIDGTHYKMQRFYVENRVFVAPQHYLFPLLDNELQETPTLTQNPGW